MRNRIISIIIVMVCFICIGCDMEDYKYPVGKDSSVVVGDGRYQILSGIESDSLFDIKTDDVIISTIKSYYDNGTDKLYVIGDGKYVIVNYDDNTYKTYRETQLDDISKDDSDIFKSNKMKKIYKEEFHNDNGVSYIYD